MFQWVGLYLCLRCARPLLGLPTFMKTLILMRHAKSSWADTDLADFDRPLNQRGLAAAPFMGKIIRHRGINPEAIISSPAKRAKDTATLVKEAAEFEAELKFEEKIYEASPLALMYVTAGIDESVETAMLVGHNPGMEGFVKALTQRVESMPTAAVAKITLNIENWYDVSANCGDLEEILRPKELLELAAV